MNPVIIQFGPLAIRWYGVMLATTIALVHHVGRRYRTPRFGIPATVCDAVAVGVYDCRAGSAPASGFVISHSSVFRQPARVRSDRPRRAGVARRHCGRAALSDLGFPPARRCRCGPWPMSSAGRSRLATSLCRIGNFINGELYGNPTTLPWGVRFPGAGDAPRHPLQVYEMILAGVIILVAPAGSPPAAVLRDRCFGRSWWRPRSDV